MGKEGGHVLTMPQNKASESTFRAFLFDPKTGSPCFRQDSVLIPVVSLEKTSFIKERE